MSVHWMIEALLVGGLLGAAAAAAERLVEWFGLPRRAVWALALFGSLLLPAAALWNPALVPDPGILPDAPPLLSAMGEEVPVIASAVGMEQGAGTGVARPRDRLPTALAWAWLLGSLVMLGAMAWTHGCLRRTRARCARVEVDGIPVYVADRLGPAVVGLLHPVIVLPRWALAAPAEDRRLILLHEREHIAARDGWLLFLGWAVVAVLPWSLALWWQHRRLREAVEADCDARVLGHGVSRRAYGRLLIRTSGVVPGTAGLGPAWGESTSQLERRIMSLTSRPPVHRLARAVPLLGMMLAASATACDLAGKAAPADPGRSTAPATYPEASPPGGTMSVRTLPDGREMIEISPDPSSGRLGFTYGWRGPTQIPEGQRMPRIDAFPVVGDVQTGLHAWEAGLRDGDTLMAVNGRDARLPRAFPDRRPGTEYTVLVRRAGVEEEIRMTVAAPEIRRTGSR